MGHEDLGHHLEETGKLKEAAEMYGRMRHDVSTTKHIMDCAQRMISVSLQRRDWSGMLASLGKITGIQNVDEERGMQPYMKIVHGIGMLGLGQLDGAANGFLAADPKVPSDTYNDIATPNDVAVYGGLAALATMDRARLQARVLDNASFRTFLEHEPHVRKAINHFVNGRYTACLALLAEHEPDYLADIYLYKHVPRIFNLIRRKCIVQYVVPFSCVTIQSLEDAFGRPGQSIEAELVRMISNKELNARIDSKEKVGPASLPSFGLPPLCPLAHANAPHSRSSWPSAPTPASRCKPRSSTPRTTTSTTPRRASAASTSLPPGSRCPTLRREAMAQPRARVTARGSSTLVPVLLLLPTSGRVSIEHGVFAFEKAHGLGLVLTEYILTTTSIMILQRYETKMQKTRSFQNYMAVSTP